MLLVDREGHPVICVEPAREEALFIQVFIGHHDDQVSARGNQRPPATQHIMRVVHVFEAVRGPHVIEPVFDELVNP